MVRMSLQLEKEVVGDSVRGVPGVMYCDVFIDSGGNLLPF